MIQAGLFAPGQRWSSALGEPNGATFSKDGRRRYLLWRTFDDCADRKPMVFVMLNPSTADASVNDPTIRRCMWFARREGAGGIVVVNLSPHRATHPRDLYAAHAAGDDIVYGLKNGLTIFQAFRMGGPVVFAWGAGVRPPLYGAIRNVRRRALEAGQSPLCLGRTKDADPRHPLMLRNDTPLESYDGLAAAV